MSELKIQLIFRLAEMPAMDQWVTEVLRRALAKQQNRRPVEQELDANPNPDGYENDPLRKLIPEKEFLLTVAPNIETNPRTLPPPAKRSLGMEEWIGNQYLWSVTHNNRLTFNHIVWQHYLRTPPPEDPRDAYAPFGNGPNFLDLWDY